MRVLHIIPSIAPSRGGPTYVLVHLSRALREQGVDVEVLSTTADLDAQAHAQVLHDLDGAEVELLPTMGPARLDLSPGFASALRRRLRRADLVHVHTVFTYPALLAPMMARWAGRPYIIRTVGTLDEACINLRSAWQKRLMLRMIGRRNLLGAAAVHVTSPLEQREVAARFPGARLSLVELGVDLGSAAPARPGPGRTIGFLGRVHPIKRVDVLVRALQHLPGVQLQVAGADEARTVGGLKALAAQLGVGDRVHWLGHLDEAGKRSLFASCDLFAFPSLHESFGIAVAEAMAAGRAVVVSPGVGLADDVRARGAGVVAEAEPARFAEAIAPLLADGTARARAGAAGRELALERFGWQAAGKRTLAMYHQAIAGE